MEVRIRKDKKTGETFIEYGASFNAEVYRYKLLKKIIEGRFEVVLIIDTNQRIGDADIQNAEDLLRLSGIKYVAFPVKQNNIRFFGIAISRKSANEKMIVMELNCGQFSSELYETLFKRFDIAIGMDRLRPFDEICENLRIDSSEVLFNTSFFKESIYDSVVCKSLRSTAIIDRYIEAAINEAAL